MDLTDKIRKEIMAEVKTSLAANKRSIEQAASDMDSKMKEVNELMENQLNEFNYKKKQFFRFDGVKNFFFWFSQAISIITLGLLVYFLFFKR